MQEALTDAGMALDFWKIAMRPGKPLMVGRLGAMRVLGLPGNPVSTFVCAEHFPEAADPRDARPAAAPERRQPRRSARRCRRTTAARTMSARALSSIVNGERIATPFAVQDSSMLATLAAADALIVRPIRAPAAAAGERRSGRCSSLDR